MKRPCRDILTNYRAGPPYEIFKKQVLGFAPGMDQPQIYMQVEGPVLMVPGDLEAGEQLSGKGSVFL